MLEQAFGAFVIPCFAHGRGLFSRFRRPSRTEVESNVNGTMKDGLEVPQRDKQSPPSFEEYWEMIQAILLFEPPVGALALFLVMRLLWSGRIFRLHSSSTASSKKRFQILTSTLVMLSWECNSAMVALMLQRGFNASLRVEASSPADMVDEM